MVIFKGMLNVDNFKYLDLNDFFNIQDRKKTLNIVKCGYILNNFVKS